MRGALIGCCIRGDCTPDGIGLTPSMRDPRSECIALIDDGVCIGRMPIRDTPFIPGVDTAGMRIVGPFCKAMLPIGTTLAPGDGLGGLMGVNPGGALTTVGTGTKLVLPLGFQHQPTPDTFTHDP